MMWKFEEFKDNIALIEDSGNQLSYNELQSLGDELSIVIPKRSLIFCLCSNNIGSMIGYTSFINNNSVALLLSSNIDVESLSQLMQTYEPNFLWLQKGKTKEYNLNGEIIYHMHNYELCEIKDSKPVCMNEELALLLSTSGSTGSPKLVKQSYKNIISNTESIVNYLNIDSSEAAITTLPMNYTYGLSIINTHLYSGAKLLLTDKTLIDKIFWQFFKREKATSFGGVPYNFEILNKLRFTRMDLPSLRYFTQAGGKLSPVLHKHFAEYAIAKDKKFFIMYGQTEATARMAYLPSEKSLEKYGFMGIAIPGGEFKLIDGNDLEIADCDVVGELVYTGDNVTLGYAEKQEDLAAGDERNGVLYTGDMAQRDNEGYYKIVGRKKRFLKIFGNRVNLDEVERLIKAKFDIIDCACSGTDDNLSVFISDDISDDEIKDYISQKTKLNRSAFKVIIIGEIPKNESGKILYSKLI